MADLIFTHSYLKRARKFFKRHPELLTRYGKILELLELNPYHPSLRLHRLKGKLPELHSVSINISYRISLDFIIEKDTIIPVDIGTHDELYG